VNEFDDDDFPAAWVRASLDQVCVSIADGDHQPPPQVERGVPFLVIGNMRGGRIDFSETRFVSESYFDLLGEPRRPSRGDVLYSVTGSFGIPVLVSTEQSFCVQRHIAILKPASQMLSGYLARALGTAAVFRQASNVATGTAQKTVGLKHLRKFTVPVAPLPEQHRIVEAIESYFSRLDEAVATLERVQRNLNRYQASVLKAAVEGRLVPTEAEVARAERRDYEPASVLLKRILHERRRRWHEALGPGKCQEPVAPDATELPELPEGWCWASVDALLREPLRNGHSARKAVGGHVRTLTLSAVTERDFSEANTKLTAADGRQIRDLWLEPGDIFVERSNTPALVGAAALYRGPRRFAIFPDLLIRVRPAKGMLPLYMEAVLRSPRVRTVFRQAAQGIAGSMPKISQETVGGLAVPLPPIIEQTRIVAELERRLSVADEAEASVTMGQTRGARLRQSILKWAFEGKLAYQDPNDEPASALLERIRSQTSASHQSASDADERPRRRHGSRSFVRAEKKP